MDIINHYRSVMLKALLGYVTSVLGLNKPSVRKAVKAHIEKRLREAEARVKEDVSFATDELKRNIKASTEKFVEEKEAAVKRQANALLTKLLD